MIDAASSRGDPGATAEAPEVAHHEEVELRPMHLRAPSIDPGVSSFLWALLFFLILWLGMVAVGVSGATALLFALVASFFIFLFVRTQGAGRKR